MKNLARAKSFIRTLLLSLLILSGLLPTQVNADIVGVQRNPATISVFDDGTWAIVSSNDLTLSGFTLSGANAVTWDSDNLLFYAIVRVGNGTGARRLVIVDPATGVCTDIGLMDDAYSTLSYSSSTGILYTMVGAGGTNAYKLYSVDMTDGSTTFLGGPFDDFAGDGSVIAYNYDDGFLYHWTGFSKPKMTPKMGKIDLNTMTETEVVQSGDPHDEIYGAVYIGGGIFVVTDIGRNTFFITKDGHVTAKVIGLLFPPRGLGYADPLLPVELSSFVSSISGNEIILNWTTASETNNSEFDIERRDAKQDDWSRVGNVTGYGTSSNGHSYSFTDRNLASGNYSYRLKQIDFNGNFKYFNLSNEVIIGIPTKYDLSQNYPNPFNPSTNIKYEIPFDGKVSIKIFDISGKEIAVLVNDFRTAGYYSVNFNASDLSSGIYFYRIEAEGNGNNFVSAKKMTVIK